MNNIALISNTEITAYEACRAAHANPANATAFGTEALYTDGTGPISYPRFHASASDALTVALLNIAPSEFEGEDDGKLADCSVAVNVLRDDGGKLSCEIVFAPEGSDYGTTCRVSDLATLSEWFDPEWILELA